MAHEGHDHHHHHHHESPVDSVTEHRQTAVATVAVFVVTVSDTRTKTTDEGGPTVCRAFERMGHSIVGTALVKDEPSQILQALKQADDIGARVVVLTGGTGLSSRDVTVETVAPLFEKRIDGFGELFRSLSFAQIGPAAMASRAVAGVWQGKVVFALPGSVRALSLALDTLIVPEIGHLVREVSR
jgi:molybdenum cofactor biosynthesis protein B